jgi:hypothetical protein
MTTGDLRLLAGPLGLQLLAALAIGLGLIWIYRWIRARSSVAAAIFAAALLLRAGLGITLFWISYLDLPFLSSMHRGGGYWELAPDAENYMEMAELGAEDGLHVITSGSPSPNYVRTVALWLRVVGISPISGMYLNLVVFSVLCLVLVVLARPVNQWRADLPLLVLLGAFGFSPVLLIHGSQALKDDVFAFVITMGAFGALVVSAVTVYGAGVVSSRWALLAGLALWLSAVFYAAGVRAYFAFFMICSLAAVLAVVGLRLRWETLYRRLPMALVICLLTAAFYVAGAGPYERFLGRGIRMVLPASAENNVDLVAGVLTQLGELRTRFERSGGGTNVVTAVASLSDEAVFREPVGRFSLEHQSVGGYARAIVTGLATMFVPISLLQALSITNLDGGRGLLFVTDVDTLFVDATVLLSFLLLYLRWDTAKQRLPYVCYLVLLGGMTTILLAYVVTNFGTQFRLRILAVVPFWLLLLATVDRLNMLRSAGASLASRPVLRGTSD